MPPPPAAARAPGTPPARGTLPAPPAPERRHRREPARRGREGSREVSAVGPVPLAVVQIVAKADRGERPSDVVAREVEHVAPPRVTGDFEILQDLLEVQTDLQAALALPLCRTPVRVALGPVGHREEEIAERPDVEVEAAGQPTELQVHREDVVGIAVEVRP